MKKPIGRVLLTVSERAKADRWSFWLDGSEPVSLRVGSMVRAEGPNGETVYGVVEQIEAATAIEGAIDAWYAWARGNELLRVLELGLLFEVHSADPEKVTLVDGPLAPLFKYAGMVNVQLKEWVEDPSREDARKFFSNIVGNVKNVVLTPVVHALDIMAAPTRDEVPVYHYPNTVHDRDDGLAREVGRVYLRLRPELPPPPVAVHELSAVDVVIGPPNATRSMSEVEALVACVFKERWPIPAVEGQRRYTELLPFAEAERWLRAGLPPVQEMQLAAR